MKKLSILIFLLLALAGCSEINSLKTSTTIQNEKIGKENKIDEQSLTAKENKNQTAKPQTKQNEVEEALKTCEINNFKYTRDECILNAAYSEVYAYNKGESELPKLYICEAITAGSDEQYQCHWIFATLYKNLDLCKYLNDSKAEECQKAIYYKTANAEWNLSQGIPPYADPGLLVYEGTAKLTGWIVYRPFYVGEDQPHFHVADESIKDLPYLNRKFLDFNLFKVSEEIQEKLKNSSEQNPITIEVNEISFKSEGTPSIKITKTY